MKVIFELIKTLEFEILSDCGKIKGKMELFRNLENSEHFRLSTSEAEMFRLASTFPQNDEGKPIHNTDEILWTEKTFPTNINDTKEFMAKGESEAVKIVLSRIEAFYHHVLI
jgi:hypothetical protein